MKNKTKLIRAVPVLLAALAAALLTACGNVGGGQGGPTITVGSKNFTEQYILGELYAQALEDNGFTVEKRLDLGSEQIADQALQNGQIDMYPEYTGTALVATLDYKGDPSDLKTSEETYDRAKELYAQRDPEDTMLTPAPFNNGYGIFVRKEVAEKENLKTLDDLARVSGDLAFVSFSEFQNRSDGYENLQSNYPGLDFDNIKIVNNLGLRYQGVQRGAGDVGVGFTTDGQLASDNLVIMEDPKAIWPFYNPAPVVRAEVLNENPKMEEVLNSVSESLSLKTMQELNGKVDLDQEDPEDVAAEYLQEKGLVE